MSLWKIRGSEALLPEVSLFEAQSTLERATAENGQYIVLALVTHGDIFPYLEGMLDDAAIRVDDGPSYIRPISEKRSVKLPDSEGQVHIAFYQTDSSIVDLLVEARPDDNWTGLFKAGSWPTMGEAKQRLLKDAEEYVKSYLPDRVYFPDAVSEDLFYKEREIAVDEGERDPAVERERLVGDLIKRFCDKLVTATGGGDSPADIISEIYAEFQKNYDSLKDADMDDLKRMAMRRSHTLAARRKFKDLVLDSPLQLTRFLALYDDRRTSPASAAFYGALVKGMDDLVGFESALIDQGELSQKRRDAGRETAAALLEHWKGREKALASYEQSKPDAARERMEAISDAVDRMKSLESVFEQAEAVVDAHLRKLKEEEEKKKGLGGNPFEEIDKGSNSAYGTLPPPP